MLQLSPAYMERFQPNYSYMFEFEEKFMHQKTRDWMVDHWQTSVYSGAIYVALIFFGRQWMANRPKYELRGLLTLWNLGLAIFSIMGVVRTAPEFYHVLKNYGFHHSVCVPSFMYNRVSGFWVWAFVWSKLPELGDTIFIVLRKQKLIFLHWYHHMTVLMYAWFSYTEYAATARWFVFVNYSIHAMMYTYYALKAMRYSPPQWIAMMITALQIIQMVIGVTVTVGVYMYKAYNRQDCHVTMLNILLSTLMYASYFVLFSKFFHEAYLSDRKPSKSLHKAADSRVDDEYSNGKVKRN
ncbi:elongation of very long chain fatty acids protein 6 [Chelonus insularis]|uniref:elongation of very long chain fatty acids protein 6 n=1 Tax=Chelonus insularis TaxID=460826 RepID=UPI00158D9D8B|nr:elongation of very long chain fatty acids protein 6 [Chelonus insularis]